MLAVQIGRGLNRTFRILNRTLHVLMLNLKHLAATEGINIDLDTAIIYHRLPFLAFGPVFPDLYLFCLGFPSRFPLPPIKQMITDGTELALPRNGKLKATQDCLQNCNNINLKRGQKKDKDRRNLLSSADIPHAVFASCSEPFVTTTTTTTIAILFCLIHRISYSKKKFKLIQAKKTT